MMEINPAITLLIAEALVVVLLIISVMLFMMAKRKSSDRSAANALIQKVSKGGSLREQALLDDLGGDTGLDDDLLKLFANEIRDQERLLYQHVIQLYLNRDVKMLAKIDQQVQALSEPYQRLLSGKGEGAEGDPALLGEIEKIKAEQERLRGDNERLANQLGVAMETMDEVSSEYSMMFGGSKAVEELSESKERMLKIFQQGAEQFASTIDENGSKNFEEIEQV